MKKILLCGLKYDKNFGDAIINDSCRFMIENDVLNNQSDYVINEIDLTGKKSFSEYYSIKKNFYYYLCGIFRKSLSLLMKIFKKNNFLYSYLEKIRWNFSNEKLILQKVHKNVILNSDVIIFVGGGMLKYKYQNCYQYINFITKIADKYNIPVYLNSVGVEDYNLKNPKCKLLKKALNRACIKMITTRDDIIKLKNYVDSKKIMCKKVSDPAVYISNVYNIKKKDLTKVVGLGVCRGDLFLDNDININKERLLELWKNIILQLDEKNINWNIYTNGLEADNKFANELADKLGISDEKICIPNSPIELVEIISNFSGIIATRLHSCIVAYSLNVPAVGLVWNKKLKMFGDSIGYSDRFIEYENFDEKIIVNKLKEAIEEGYIKIQPEEYIKSEKESLKEFFDLYFK